MSTAAGRFSPSSITSQFAKAYATNSTDGSFTARADATTAPAAGTGVIDLRTSVNGPLVPTWVQLVFFGTGDADDVFNARIYGVRQVDSLSWTHVPILELVCTMGTKTGVASGGVTDSEKYCDTLVAASVSFGAADNSYRVVSPADNTAARVLLDCEGFPFVRVDFDLSTGSPTGANALYARL